MNQTTLQMKRTTNSPALYLSIEMASKEWKLTFGDGERIRQVNMPAGNLAKLEEEVVRARAKLRLLETCPVVSCYEAGRDGFWLHRALVARGIRNLVVDPASIEVDRRRRRAKTDRIDGRKLLSQLIRHENGERGALHLVRVPTPEQEDWRRPERERKHLQKECLAHANRIRSLLVLHGIQVKWPRGMTTRNFAAALDVLSTPTGEQLPALLQAELVREFDRLGKATTHLGELEKQCEGLLRNPQHPWGKKVAKLTLLRGVGEHSSRPLVAEFFGWREFKNQRELGGLAGLTPTPYDSGDSVHEQGISKAGNRRIRELMVELAWFWLRYQPQSYLAQWFQKRFAHAGARARRIGIVAVARRLLIQLWRWLEHDITPKGATLKVA